MSGSTDSLSLRWIIQFVYSELKASPYRYSLITISFALGVGLVSGLLLINRSLESALARESRTLLGADLVVESNRPISDKVHTIINIHSEQVSEEITFGSMIHIKNIGRSRLAQISAIKGGAPFYGETISLPKTAFSEVREGVVQGAVIDQVLVSQFALEHGDKVKVGELELPVHGTLTYLAGQSYTRSLIAPRIIIPYNLLDSTKLLQRGSRIKYRTYILQPDQTVLIALQKELEEIASIERIEIETIEKREESLGKTISNVSFFINLVSFAALVLGVIALWSTFALLVRERMLVIATLRCVGATSRQILLLYGATVIVLLSSGIVMGIFAGISVLIWVPDLIGDFLPIKLNFEFTFKPILIALAASIITGIAVLFPPLYTIKSTPALLVFSDGDTDRLSKFKFAQSIIIGGALVTIGLLVMAFALFTSASYAILITLGCVASSLLLWFSAVLLRGTVRKILKYLPRVPMLRHGFASLYRPFNQTDLIVVALGLGVCIIGVIALTQKNLLVQIEEISQGTRPNLVLFDIQGDQRLAVEKILQESSIQVSQLVPIVTMRLDEVDGVSNRELKERASLPAWVLRREYRSTFRSNLADGESLVSGTQIPYFNMVDNSRPIPITAEKSIVDRLKIKIGSKLTFDVQGVPILTEVVGIREVDWRRIQTNFFFVFPEGTLEDAPQFWAIIAKAPNIETLARFQGKLGDAFPNISAIDLSLVLETADKVTNSISQAVRVLGVILLICATLVIAGTIAASKRARRGEDILYRTLGATTGQIRIKHLSEYAGVGIIGTLLGLIIAVCASWGVSSIALKLPFAVPWFELSQLAFGAIVSISLLGFAFGTTNSAGRHSD